MEGIVDLQGDLYFQSGHQLRWLELDIPPLQTEIPSYTRGVKFESTFSESMMIEPAFIERPSTQPSYIQPSFFKPIFTKPTYIEIPPPQVPHTPDHAGWMDLSAQISSLGTRMEELVVVSDT